MPRPVGAHPTVPPRVLGAGHRCTEATIIPSGAWFCPTCFGFVCFLLSSCFSFYWNRDVYSLSLLIIAVSNTKMSLLIVSGSKIRDDLESRQSLT